MSRRKQVRDGDGNLLHLRSFAWRISDRDKPLGEDWEKEEDEDKGWEDEL